MFTQVATQTMMINYPYSDAIKLCLFQNVSTEVMLLVSNELSSTQIYLKVIF